MIYVPSHIKEIMKENMHSLCVCISTWIISRLVLKTMNLREGKICKSNLWPTDLSIRMPLYIRTCQAAVQLFIDTFLGNGAKSTAICAGQWAPRLSKASDYFKTPPTKWIKATDFLPHLSFTDWALMYSQRTDHHVTLYNTKIPVYTVKIKPNFNIR